MNSAGIYSDNEKPDEIKAPIYYIYNENNINAVEIEQEIFQQELFEYTIRDREDFIGELIRWISETKSASDKFLMMQDLEMLLKRTDDYMFSSISTNKYICQGDPEFNETCKELLELNESFKNQKNESREI